MTNSKVNNSNLPELSIYEAFCIGIVLLMLRASEYDAKLLPCWLASVVNHIPGRGNGSLVDINLLTKKVDKLDIFQLSETFEFNTREVVLPEFNEDERFIIATCMNGSIIDGWFVRYLDEEVYDCIYYGYIDDSVDDSVEPVFSDSDIELVSKVKKLDAFQRVKLLNEVYKKYFNKS